MAYVSQETKKRLVNLAKPILKKYGVKATFRIRHHMSLVCSIRSGEIDFLNDLVKNTYNQNVTLEERYSATWNRVDDNFSGKAKDFLNELYQALNDGNWDKSDIMTDYFDVGWYIDVNIGDYKRPYIYTKPSTETPVKKIDFDLENYNSGVVH